MKTSHLIVCFSLAFSTLGAFAGNVITGLPFTIPNPPGSGIGPNLYCAGRAWPNGVIPYTLNTSDGAFTNATIAMIEDSLDEWANLTNVKFVVRSTQENYLTFQMDTRIPAHGRSNCYGMQGKQQFIYINPNAVSGLNPVILEHEIGHALGLFHEHQRSDRDTYITVLYDSVRALYNFLGITDPLSLAILNIGNWNNASIGSKPLGPYDYSSIMHYSDHVDLPNGTNFRVMASKTSQTVRGEQSISPGDIAAVNTLYPREHYRILR